MPNNDVLIVAEVAEGALNEVSLELVGAAAPIAAALGGQLLACLLGNGVAEAAQRLAGAGAHRVLAADDPRLDPYQAETHLPVLVQIVQELQPAAVLLAQTFTGRELGPRLAFRLDTALATDCIRLTVEDGRLVMTKPVFGGSALAEYIIESTPQVATLRPRTFEPIAGPGTGQVEAVTVALDESAARTRVIETVRSTSDGGPSLKNAKVIVSGGRGLGGSQNWHQVEELAQALDAAVGATRAVTDAGWVAVSLQVGLTGMTVSPDLYIALGISGAVQHIAGISGAKNVVAINKDPEANIFKYARFGVAGDLSQVLPAFTRKVKELRGK